MAIFNSTAPCPYCYTHINPRRLAYRCSGRSQPDRTPCAKSPDAIRQLSFGDSDPYWPVVARVGSPSTPCQSCGAAPGSAVCPACHSPLPTEFSSAHLQVGIIGEFNSGKSTLLAAVDHGLQHAATELGASCYAASGRANWGIRQSWSMLEKGGILPPQTDLHGTSFGDPALYSWNWSGRRRARSALISFSDYSGSEFDRGEPERAAHSYATTSTALLLLLDPFNLPANSDSRQQRGIREPYFSDACERVLQHVVRGVRQARGIKPGRQIPVPLACVVGKMDAFADQRPLIGSAGDATGHVEGSPRGLFRNSSSEIRTTLSEWGAGSLVRNIEAEFSKVRYFGVSALGSEPDYANARLSARPIRPTGVLAPFLWFMVDKGLVQSKHLDQLLKESA